MEEKKQNINDFLYGVVEEEPKEELGDYDYRIYDDEEE